MNLKSNIQGIYQELSSVYQQIMNVEQETMLLESFIRKGQNKVDDLYTLHLLDDDEFHQFESYIDAGFILKVQVSLRNYSLRRISLNNEDREYYNRKEVEDFQDIANDILQKINRGYRSQDYGYQKRLNIVETFGMFYSLTDLFELFKRFKSEWISTSGIEDYIIDACCNAEMKQFASVFINKYEWYLARIESECINKNNSLFLIKNWLALFAEYPRNTLVLKEYGNGIRRKDNTEESIDLDNKIISYITDIEGLWKLRDTLQQRKLMLLESKEMETRALEQARLAEIEKLRMRISIRKKKEEELQRKRYYAQIEAYKNRMVTPSRIWKNDQHLYDLSSIGDYMDSKDRSETK